MGFTGTPTAGEIALSNEALGLLDETAITTTSTTEKAFVLCDRYYTQAINEMLQRHMWREATERAVIGQASVPPFGYDYKYTLPTDFLRFYRIDNTSLYGNHPRYSDKPYSVEGTSILCNEGYVPDAYDATSIESGKYYLYDSAAYLCLLDDATDLPDAVDSTEWTLMSSYGVLLRIIYCKEIAESAFTPLLRECVKYNLAAKVAPGLRDTETAMALQSHLETVLLREAKSIDSMEKFPVQQFNSEWINSRQGR